MEMQKSYDKFHPICQDIRQNRFDKTKTELRFYHQYPLYNYGMIPQTWENPFEIKNEIENLKGDGDPLDILEASTELKYEIGSVIECKVLGGFCLIDQEEVDWKIIVLNKEEADKKKIYTLEELDKQDPGRLMAMFEWFRKIKTYEGKKENRIFQDKYFGISKAFEIIEENHHQWNQLKANSVNEQLITLQNKYFFK